jgi:hypothetical protein
VRISAIKALILRGGNWLPSLQKYAFSMSAWEQFQICEAFSKRQSIALPDFTPLLSSFNPTVVLFGLRMVKHFHSLDALDSVLPFIKNENPKIAEAAKAVLEQFGMEDLIEENKDLNAEILQSIESELQNIVIMEEPLKLFEFVEEDIAAVHPEIRQEDIALVLNGYWATSPRLNISNLPQYNFTSTNQDIPTHIEYKETQNVLYLDLN